MINFVSHKLTRLPLVKLLLVHKMFCVSTSFLIDRIREIRSSCCRWSDLCKITIVEMAIDYRNFIGNFVVTGHRTAGCTSGLCLDLIKEYVFQ